MARIIRRDGRGTRFSRPTSREKRLGVRGDSCFFHAALAALRWAVRAWASICGAVTLRKSVSRRTSCKAANHSLGSGRSVGVVWPASKQDGKEAASIGDEQDQSVRRLKAHIRHVVLPSMAKFLGESGRRL